MDLRSHGAVLMCVLSFLCDHEVPLRWGSCSLRERERQRKSALNVGCCVIPPRAPLLFLCLGPHVTVGYFLWWVARINRSSNVHPGSQQLQLHDWWDYTSLIYFIIVGQARGEWRDGLCSMRNVTCDCRYGMGDYPNVRFVLGLHLICVCQLLSEAFFSLLIIQLCLLNHSAPIQSCWVIALLCHGSFLWSRSSPYDIYGAWGFHACSL